MHFITSVRSIEKKTCDGLSQMVDKKSIFRTIVGCKNLVGRSKETFTIGQYSDFIVWDGYKWDIYIYIIIHRQTVSLYHNYSVVAIHTRFPKLGSKRGWLKRQSKILLLYIYIYIYIYCHPQTDLFRSIRTHQCG